MWRHLVSHSVVSRRAQAVASRQLSGKMARFNNWHATARCMVKNPSYVVHFGNLLAVAAMGSSDMFTLRSFSICASFCGIAFNLLQPKPLWAPAAWGVFFIFGHSVQIARLILAKSVVSMNEDENRLYEEAFLPFGFSPKQYMGMLEAATPWTETKNKGENVFKRGTTMENLSYLLDGAVAIRSVSGETLHVVTPGKGGWVGEFFDSDWDLGKEHRWQADSVCVSEGGCLLKTFCKYKLHRHIKDNSKSIEVQATRVQVGDLWGKLKDSFSEKEREVYRGMLELAVADGEVVKEEREACAAFRARNAAVIKDSVHAQTLESLGWTVAEFDAGRKHT